jgi:serine/threonine-protein kinase
LAITLERETKLRPVELCNLMIAVADVLATVHHHGIVHRDLKPDNLLFAGAESGFLLRVIDWGVARLGPAARLTLEGETCGTPIYMSPEQAYGRDIGPPCDIYSLGVIAYEALAGQPPFDGRTLAEVVALHLHGEAAPLSSHCPAAPRALCALVHRMLDKTPSRRPDATEVRDTMQQLAIGIASAHREFESYEIITVPELATIWVGTLGDVPIDLSVKIRRPRWTPELPVAIATEWTRPLKRARRLTSTYGEILRTH